MNKIVTSKKPIKFDDSSNTILKEKDYEKLVKSYLEIYKERKLF